MVRRPGNKAREYVHPKYGVAMTGSCVISVIYVVIYHLANISVKSEDPVGYARLHGYEKFSHKLQRVWYARLENVIVRKVHVTVPYLGFAVGMTVECATCS